MAVSESKKPASALGVRALDDHTVEIELEHPAPFVLQALAEPIAAPWRPDAPGASKSTTTNGPYVIKERRSGSSITLERNPLYWDRLHVQVPVIHYEITESESTELREYLAGQLDLTYTVPLSNLSQIETERPTEIQSAPILGTMYLALNLSKPYLGNDRQLREALSIALDRSSITDHLTLGASPAYSFVSRGISNYVPFIYDWSTWPREKQLELARKSYAESGYSKSHPLKLTLYYNSNESITRIMVAVADAWKRNLGVETNLSGEEFRVFLDGRKDHSKWDAARLGWWADYNDPSSFLDIFSSTGIQNDPGYKSVDFNNLLEASRIEPNETRRNGLFSQAEKTLLTDYPIIPVYFYSAKHLVKPGLEGAHISPLNRTYSRHLYWFDSQKGK